MIDLCPEAGRHRFRWGHDLGEGARNLGRRACGRRTASCDVRERQWRRWVGDGQRGRSVRRVRGSSRHRIGRSHGAVAAFTRQLGQQNVLDPPRSRHPSGRPPVGGRAPRFARPSTGGRPARTSPTLPQQAPLSYVARAEKPRARQKPHGMSEMAGRQPKRRPFSDLHRSERYVRRFRLSLMVTRRSRVMLRGFRGDSR